MANRGMGRSASYGVAVLAVGVAFALKLALREVVGPESAFLLFCTGIAVGAWYGGLGPGLLATAVAAVLAHAYFLPAAASAGPASTLTVLVFLAEGATVSVLGATVDAAKRGRREARAAAAEQQAARDAQNEGRDAERFRLALEACPTAVLMVDREGRIMLLNAQAEHLFGYTRDELVGQSVERLVPERLRDRHPAYRADFKAAPRRRPMGAGRDLYAVRKDGEEVPVEIGLNPVAMEGGVVVLASIIEITERKRAEEKREELLRELEAKNAEMDRFVFTVSHDLKSPLLTIQGFAGMLERDATSGDLARLRTDVERIGKAATKMRQLLDELLELSRIGRIVRPPEVVRVGEVAGEVLDLLAGRIAARGVRVTLAPDLPTVWADRSRLGDVLQNLIDNAVKFMGDQRAPQVVVGRRRNGRDASVLFVHDNGIGIPPAYHDKIFGLFEKLDANAEGTGVGLALVKRIVELHGGHIWVESDGPGQGSTFCFTLGKTSGEEHAEAARTATA